MKNLSFLLLLFVALFITSCEDEEQLKDITTPDLPVAEAGFVAALTQALPPSGNDADPAPEDACFTFNFPLGFVLEDGTSVSYDTEDDLEAGLNADQPIVDFVYPFSVTLADGAEQSITDFEGVFAILTDCYGDMEGWDDHGSCPYDPAGDAFCFDFAYPLTVAVDGDNQTFDSEQAFTDFLSAQDSITIPFIELVFPFDIILIETDETLPINTEDDFADALMACDFSGGGDGGNGGIDTIGFDGAACFSFAYPITLAFDTVEIVINTEEEFQGFLLASGPDNHFDLVYPVNLNVEETGEVVTVNNDEEFEAVLAICFGGTTGGVDDMFGCASINYPVDALIDGGSVTVADDEALAAALDGSTTFAGFAFPFAVTVTATGEVITLNSPEDLVSLDAACN